MKMPFTRAVRVTVGELLCYPKVVALRNEPHHYPFPLPGNWGRFFVEKVFIKKSLKDI